MAVSTKITRAPGLPAEKTDGHFFAFDQMGRVWAITWSDEHGCFLGAGWGGKWPTTMAFKGEAAQQVVSHIENPVHLMELEVGTSKRESAATAAAVAAGQSD